FDKGPHDGKPKDFMSNIIIFGKNPFHVDAIGLWLGGHEPGNFGLLHMALERGMSTLLNPHDIPVYEWSSDSSATLTPLDSFARTPLLTYYLQRDYDGQNEDYWHLVNEPFDYSSVHVQQPALDLPKTFDLGQNYPNPFNSRTVIDFTLPRPGHVQVSVHNASGQTVAILHNGYAGQGHHMLSWRAHDVPSGAYFYRCQFEGYAKTGRMLLIR
ncbi:T9SS type A sorting domain-containing protein, partial [candidate division KSB1 bacterium]|nr:T9SS type A sorting domain-containing protein [candidate division KSB1 bacterium]